jgi:transposase
MRFVPIKSEQQQSGLMLHRTRQLLVRQRTMLSNAIPRARGHMTELGIISAKGRNGTAELLQIIGDVTDSRIPPVARSGNLPRDATASHNETKDEMNMPHLEQTSGAKALPRQDPPDEVYR